MRKIPSKLRPKKATRSEPHRAPINIFHVVFSLEPGGLENGLINVARALNPDAFRVQICCLEQAGSFATRLPPEARVFVLDRKPGFSLRTVYRLGKTLAEAKPDLVHSHNLGPLIYSALATKLGRSCPILHSEHGQLPPEHLSRKRLLQRRWLYRVCHKVQTVSGSLRQHLIEVGLPASRIVALTNGVDTYRFFPVPAANARERLGLPADGPVLGIVGRFDPAKRHELLFAGFGRIAQERPRARLLVVGGGGSESERVPRLAKDTPAAERIHLTGMQDDPRPYYQAMDLLVAPSTVEGLSNVVLEAMACGVPVLAHTACGNAEVITTGQDGWVANLETVELLVEQLRAILASPQDLARAGQRARATVVSRFSLANMVQQYERLYLEVACNHP